MYLGIDTATLRGSVALARGARIIEVRQLTERSAHARDLMTRVHALLESQGLRARDLRGIGAAVGPGSFTGVRIGLATAKGLAYALGIPATGISTLEAVALAARREAGWNDGAIGAALEAGRGEIYWALFAAEAGLLRRLTEDRSCSPEALIGDLPGRLLIAGGAAATVARLAEGRGATAPTVLESTGPLAAAIALRAAETLPEGAPYRPGELGPNYVRPPDAEVPRRRS